MSAGRAPTEEEIQARVGAVRGGSRAVAGGRAAPAAVAALDGREIRGGMDNYIRFAPPAGGRLGRVADELQRAAREGNAALLALAARLRARASGRRGAPGHRPAHPVAPRPTSTGAGTGAGAAGAADGFGLGLAQQAQIHLAAGGQV